MDMKRGSRFVAIFVFLVPLISKAALGFNQTPEPVPPGAVQAGIEGFAVPYIYFSGGQDSVAGLNLVIQGFQNVHVQTGITPKLALGLDYEIARQAVGAEFTRSLIEDYLAAGADFSVGLGRSLGDYTLQTSVIAGYPGKVLAPYGVFRLRGLYSGPTDDSARFLFSTQLVAGARLKFLKILSLYAELGASFGKFSRTSLRYPSVFVCPIAGAGLGVDINFKKTDDGS